MPDGWTLTDLSCTQTGASSVVEDVPAAEVSITLAARDNVVCTFTNAVRPPEGELFIEKITRGSTGLFNFEIFPRGGGQSRDARARTQEPNVAVSAEPSPLTLGPGRYRIRERLPRSRAGDWRLNRVFCNGNPVPVRRPPGRRVSSVGVTIEPDEGAACTFVNRFTPAGAIVIDKATVGGTGTAGFTISPVGDPDTTYSQSVTTREPGEPTRARGDRTNRLPLGRYVIQEQALAPEDNRSWTLTEVLCDNTVVPSEEGRVVVRLTRRDPRVRCLFVNTLNTGPLPPLPPQPPSLRNRLSPADPTSSSPRGPTGPW